MGNFFYFSLHRSLNYIFSLYNNHFYNFNTKKKNIYKITYKTTKREKMRDENEF